MSPISCPKNSVSWHVLSAHLKSINLWTYLDHVRTIKLPCPTWRRRWWWKPGVYSRKTKMFFSPSPLFLWLWNRGLARSQGAASSSRPTCKPHEPYPSKSLLITLLSRNSSLHWDTNGQRSSEPTKTQPDSFGFSKNTECLILVRWLE